MMLGASESAHGGVDTRAMSVAPASLAETLLFKPLYALLVHNYQLPLIVLE